MSRVGRPSEYKPEYCEAVIKHMSEGNSFWSFAADCDVSMETLSNWTQQYPEFLEAKKIGYAKLLKFDENMAKAGSNGQLKRVARIEKITDKNGETREVTHYDAAQFAQTYHIFKMKNRYPKLYRDKITIEDGAKTSKTDQRLKKLMTDPEAAKAAYQLAKKMVVGDADE